jgi:hypothetical protein
MFLLAFFSERQTAIRPPVYSLDCWGLFDATIGLKLSLYFKANMGLTQEQVDKMKSGGTSIFMITVGILFGSFGFVIAGYTL